MSDIQTCLASFAVASGSPTGNSREAVDRAIDAYLGSVANDEVQAISDLKAGFEAMMLDGAVAVHISARIDEELSARRQSGASDAS
jgi:hypothetical protein